MNSRLAALPTPLLALLAGALNVLAFAPLGYWPLQIAALALLFRLVLHATSIKRSALLGWAYGFGWMACCVYWPYVSMHRYGGMPAGMAALAVVLLALLLGGFSACATACSAWLRQRWLLSTNAALLLLLPAAWMLSEWLRGWVFTGFPWVASGYAHTSSPLAGFAPIIGVYGLAWLSALIAGSIVLLPTKKWLAVPALLLLGAGQGLQTIDWTERHGQPISVRLLQGNVPQEIKFDAEQLNATLALYYDMIRQAPADLIATPETALPLLAHQLPPDYLPLLAQFSQRSNSTLAIGVPISDAPNQYTNSVIGLAPNSTRSAQPYRYDKHHLVPFGEFVPAGFHWFVDMMHIPLGDQTPGPELQAPFAVKDQWVLPNICYEDLFGEEIAAQLRGTQPATILLNLSNIAWFGDTLALPQHLQISQMRALETGRPMLRATNTGTTAVIDPKGRVVAQLAPFERTGLTASVQGFEGLTPYLLWGNGLIVALALLMLGIAWCAARKNRTNSLRIHGNPSILSSHIEQ